MSNVAIMRTPYKTFSSTSDILKCGIKFKKALRQHQKLRGIYKRHGYKVELLPPSAKYSASVFMQDVAFISENQALLTNCMSKWRLKEARHRNQLNTVLRKYVDVVGQMGLPAELDVGEVVKTDREYLVGVSKKTAHEGIKQIQKKLDLDLPIKPIERHWDYMVHLGSGLSYLGDDYLLATEFFKDYKFLKKYNVIWAPKNEPNGANVVRLADGCLIADSRSPYTCWQLQELGWEVETVDLSEYNKASGHISCLSINLDL